MLCRASCGGSTEGSKRDPVKRACRVHFEVNTTIYQLKNIKLRRLSRGAYKACRFDRGASFSLRSFSTGDSYVKAHNPQNKHEGPIRHSRRLPSRRICGELNLRYLLFIIILFFFFNVDSIRIFFIFVAFFYSFNNCLVSTVA